MGAEEPEFSLGTIIKETGDFGRFQFVLIVFFNSILLILNWSMMFMTFTAANPHYTCYVFDDGYNLTGSGNWTKQDVCSINGTSCDVIDFDYSMKTAVNEWDLICDKKWIAQTMTTIQMSGLLVGGLFWGHVSDGIGRKPTLFLNIALLMVFNLVAFFSTSWEMFAAVRFGIGFACTGFMSGGITFEYIRNKWRVYLFLFPGWAIWASIMAVFCWQVHEWRYIHLVVACCCPPALLMWFFIPESFRWLVSHGRLEEAANAIARVARFNGKPVPDMKRVTRMLEVEKEMAEEARTLQVYSVLDLFRTGRIRKICLLFASIWLFSAYSYYGIAYGVQELSGSLYMNMFLVSIVDFPGNILVVVLNHWFGRKWTSIGCYVVGGAFGLTVGIVQFTGAGLSGGAVNGLALTAKLFISAAWEINTLWSSESFPTVIRNIGGGFLSSISRLGSMVAPQIVSLSQDTPGLLYMVSGIVTLISGSLCFFLEETKDKDLTDLLPAKKKKMDDNPAHVQIEHTKQ